MPPAGNPRKPPPARAERNPQETKRFDPQRFGCDSSSPRYPGRRSLPPTAAALLGLRRAHRAGDVVEGADARVLPARAPDQAQGQRGQVTDGDEADIVAV